MQKNITYWNFDWASKGSNDDDFGQMKYEHDKCDKVNAMVYNSRDEVYLDKKWPISETCHYLDDQNKPLNPLGV